MAPFLDELTHQAQQRICPMYVAGLIGPSDRKSIQTLAALAGDACYDQLHSSIVVGTWDTAPFENMLLAGRTDWSATQGFLVIDDTALPKVGRHSVGGATIGFVVGQTTNCQSLVSVTLASREASRDRGYWPTHQGRRSLPRTTALCSNPRVKVQAK